jgi:hypothetical protein
MKKQHYVLSTLTVAMAALLPGMSYANPVNFNAGGLETVTGITAFDWAPSNVLAYGGNDAFVNYINSGGACPDNSCQFQTYVQGSLSAFLGAPGTDLGVTYEITYQMSFRSEVAYGQVLPGDLGAMAIFDFVEDPDAENYFNIYFDESINADDLAGTGFTDGTLVMSGTVNAPSGTTSNFQTGGGPTEAIGGDISTNGGNGTPAAWADYQTVTGSGSTGDLSVFDLQVSANSYDSNFFTNGLEQMLLVNISQQLAFTSVDPALRFENSETGLDIDVQSEVGTYSGVNGGTYYLDGSNVLMADGGSIIFQTDMNSPVVGLPEPSIFALLGLGGLLGGIAVGQRKKKGSSIV